MYITCLFLPVLLVRTYQRTKILGLHVGGYSTKKRNLVPRTLIAFLIMKTVGVSTTYSRRLHNKKAIRTLGTRLFENACKAKKKLKIKICQSDITTLHVDAIVNAGANKICSRTPFNHI